MRAIPSAKHFYLVWIFMIFIFALSWVSLNMLPLTFSWFQFRDHNKFFQDMNIISVGRIPIILILILI